MQQNAPVVFRRADRLLTVALFAWLPLHAATARASFWPGATHSGHVLRVGSWHGIPGNYSNIQSAVDAAKPGDWILVGPGDYHEQGDRVHPPVDEASGGGVYITTGGVHIRGMDRNRVVVDGTRAGAPQCSAAPTDQDFGQIGRAHV